VWGFGDAKMNQLADAGKRQGAKDEWFTMMSRVVVVNLVCGGLWLPELRRAVAFAASAEPRADLRTQIAYI